MGAKLWRTVFRKITFLQTISPIWTQGHNSKKNKCRRFSPEAMKENGHYFEERKTLKMQQSSIKTSSENVKGKINKNS